MKKLKILWAICLTVALTALCLLVLPTQAQAATEGYYTYEVANGEATITGYTGDGGDITIPSTLGGYPVTAIGKDAFQNNTGLKRVIIPDSVRIIKRSAFWGCIYMTSVTIGNDVSTIEEYAFAHCGGLISITIPNSVTTLGSFAFYYCGNLTQVNIGNGVTSIGDATFYKCRNLDSVIIGNNVTSIGIDAFYLCDRLRSITMGENVTIIESDAFSHCAALTCINIPNSVITINKSAFHNCTSLSKVIYCGTEQQWNQISIDSYNTSLTNATRQYHDYQGGICTVCGAADPDYVAPIGKFNLSGMTMSLGNSLAANFVVAKDNLTGNYNYAIIEKAYADGTTKSVTIPQSQWQAYGETGYYFTYAGVTAKEMTDVITVNVYNSDGVQIMNTYTRTIEDYCYQQMLKEEPKNTAESREKLALYVDILKYGAAAQNFFENYHGDCLATYRLSEAQLAYGAQDAEMTDIRVKGEGYKGTTLSLKNEISMNFVFVNGTIDQAAYAVVSFTDHYGNPKEKTVQAADFGAYGTTGKYIVVDGMSVADCSARITVKLYKANGAVLSITIDSVEAYIARMSGADALYPAIIKLATSAYNYFH